MTAMSGYKISDEDIDGVVRFMKIFHPENANRDYCRAMLEAVQSGVIAGLRIIALTNADEIEALYEKYETYLKDNGGKV
jgi:hypothetical protein